MNEFLGRSEHSLKSRDVLEGFGKSLDVKPYGHAKLNMIVDMKTSRSKMCISWAINELEYP